MALSDVGSRSRQPIQRHPGADRPDASPSTARLTGMLAGTRLLTPKGYRPVETLRRGDMVATLIGRGPMFVPITWIGHRKADSADQADPPPVRFRRNAIGDTMPNRDILLAPDHGLYLRGTLYLAGHLVNNASILPDPRQPVAAYWGVQLERHNVLVAENLGIESLLPASAAAFAEVTAPSLTVVGAAPRAEQDDDTEAVAPLGFPAHIRMSVRWFRRRLQVRARTAAVPVPTANMPPTPAPRADGLLDVEAEIRAVMGGIADPAAQKGVRLEFAVAPGLVLRMQQDRFHELLGAVLTHAIYAVAGGHILVGAMHHAGRVQIAVIDDDGGTDRERREMDLRPTAALAQLEGATLEVDARPGEGTTVLLRLLAPPQVG